MVDELAGKSVGERIQIIRERRGKSRAVVAGLVGRSEGWLKSVEKGRLLAPRLDMLLRLAEVLGVQDLGDLTGSQSIPIGVMRRAGHDAVPGIREAIEQTPLTVPSDPRPDPADLAHRAADAWHVWHTSPTPRADVGATLAQLIRDCQRAVRVLDGAERRRAYAALAEVYALAEQALAWVAETQLVWLVADRCMHAAQQADDPLALAGASWVLGNVYRVTGREDEALALVDEAASLLEPQLDGGYDEARGMWGALRLHAAITHAGLGREGDALRYWDLGAEMAGRLPAGYAHPWTVFGRPNVDVHAVSVNAYLRKGGRAIEEAERLDPDTVPSLERQSRLWLEMARSYHQRKDNVAALTLLRRAADVSVEAMSCHPLARGIAGELVTSGGRLVEREARALARNLGLIAA